MMRKFHNTLTGIALLFNIRGIPHLTRIYRKIYFDRKTHRGKSDSIAFLKALLVCGERYALHQPIDPVPWTKSDKDCFPTIIRDFKPYLRGNRFERILALSVLRSVESLRLPVSHDIRSVTDPPVYSGELVRKILDFAGEKMRWLKPLNLKPLKYHLTFKKGPNGPALKTSDSDVAGLFMDPKILGAIQVVQEKLGGSYPIDETFRRSKSPGILSKLTQFPEKAGKTRTIAVIDYYSQRALKPLHKAIMSLLKSLESDGTYSHRNVGLWAQQKTREKSHIFCADLTAATDRFPAELQRGLLNVIVPDKDLSAALWTLLAERTFTVEWSGEKVQYSTGQPMGAYASWPLFALAHHITAEYCYGRSSKSLYRMIGDDFMSSSEVQSQRYKEVMRDLGVSINFNKTVESPKGSKFASAEVAKQLFLNGDNLSPLTPGFVLDLVKPHMFNMCLAELRSRYDPLPVAPSVLLNSIFKRRKLREKVWLLASNPRNGSIKPSDEGYDEYSPWAKKDLGLYDIVYRNLFVNSLTMKAEIMFSELLDSEDHGFQESPRKDSDPRCDAQYHVEEQLRADLSDAMMELNRMEAFAFDPSDSAVDTVQFLSDPRDQYKSRKELRCTVESYLIEQVLPELPERSTTGGMLETTSGKVSMMGF